MNVEISIGKKFGDIFVSNFFFTFLNNLSHLIFYKMDIKKEKQFKNGLLDFLSY